MGQETSEKAQVALAIVCKRAVSRPGGTGLSPPLSLEEAAQLSGCFLADMAQTIADLDAGAAVHGVAACAPADSEDAVRRLLPEGFTVMVQRGTGFDERFGGLVDDLAAAGHGAVCLLNGDSPTLPGSVLRDALTALARPGERIVLGPTIEGGWTLIGMQRPLPELFARISLNARRARQQMIERAGALSLPVEMLTPWYEVADGLSLSWLLRELIGDGKAPLLNGLPGAPAPRTLAYLASLGRRGDGPPPDPGPNARDPRGRG